MVSVRWLSVFCVLFATPSLAKQIDIQGPAGSVAFGLEVHALPNGNIVVSDPNASVPVSRAGAVYLYSANGTLISALRGSAENDSVGDGGVTVLSNGNFVVLSRGVARSGSPGHGAATWVNGSLGLDGPVSESNSLVGNSYYDFSLSKVVEVGAGNYVVVTPNFSVPGGASSGGAVTWADGNTGRTGVISPAIALVGGTQNDQVGWGGVVRLSNGNYVVASPNWSMNMPGGSRVGAFTWGNGAGGSVGFVTSVNSLVGQGDSSSVGEFDSRRITRLTNGNYVVQVASWSNGANARAGAVTWCNGSNGSTVGTVSALNSLVGTNAEDRVGGWEDNDVIALANGNYVVVSGYWNGVRGAATWANGTTGLIGTVSAANSLVGASAGGGPTYAKALTNGNYVVVSVAAGFGSKGAATWANGTTGLVGTVSAANSLMGSSLSDMIGYNGVVALSNGNYLVVSNNWDNTTTGAQDAGAVTWGNGTSGLVGVVSATNSLVGTTAFDYVGGSGYAYENNVLALPNGNYVVPSLNWDNGAVGEVGAVTWGNGATGVKGAVSAANSLVGAQAYDRVGSGGAVSLPYGNYVIVSPLATIGGVTAAGAVTRVAGAASVTGVVSSANSLYGSSANDNVGSAGVRAYADGAYVVTSPLWDAAGQADAGAVSIAPGSKITAGPVAVSNSVLGTVASSGSMHRSDYGSGKLVVGRPESNVVTILLSDAIFADSLE